MRPTVRLGAGPYSIGGVRLAGTVVSTSWAFAVTFGAWFIVMAGVNARGGGGVCRALGATFRRVRLGVTRFVRRDATVACRPERLGLGVLVAL